jgi:hypothetical protein
MTNPKDRDSCLQVEVTGSDPRHDQPTYRTDELSRLASTGPQVHEQLKQLYDQLQRHLQVKADIFISQMRTAGAKMRTS